MIEEIRSADDIKTALSVYFHQQMDHPREDFTGAEYCPNEEGHEDLSDTMAEGVMSVADDLSLEGLMLVAEAFRRAALDRAEARGKWSVVPPGSPF